MLKYRADVRTLAFMAVTTALLFVQWNLEQVHPLLFIWGCVMAVSVTAIAHNHNHLGLWESSFLNKCTDVWLTLFYGFPVFAWIPTHNQNHHRYNNREEDYTATYKVSENNNLLTLLAYPIHSGGAQQKVIYDYLKKIWYSDRPQFVHCMVQVTALVIFYAGALWLSWKKALLFIIVPHQVGLNSVLIFNYIQHVHADEDSQWNHSRNVLSPRMNGLLFNNGFHTVHHMNPRKHWSVTPQAHAEIQHKIDPSLNEPSFTWFFGRTYLLSWFVPRYRSVPMNPKVSVEGQRVVAAAVAV